MSRIQNKVKNTVLLVRVSKTNENGPLSAEQMFSALHGILRKSSFLKHLSDNQEQISFEIGSTNLNICFYICVPEHLCDFVIGQIYAQYPDIEVTILEKDYTNVDFEIGTVSSCELKLSKHYVFPIKRIEDFEDKIVRVNLDTLSSITESLRNATKLSDERVWIQIVIKPVKDYWWNKVSAKTVDLLSKNKEIFLLKFMGNDQIIVSDISWYYRILLLPIMPIIWLLNFIAAMFHSTGSSSVGSIKTEDGNTVSIKTAEYNSDACKALIAKAQKPAFLTEIRILHVTKEKNQEKKSMQKVFSVAASFKQFHSSSFNGFENIIECNKRKYLDYVDRIILRKEQFLNTEELATIYHLPNIMVQTPGIFWVTSKKIEPPSDLPSFRSGANTELCVLGNTNFRGTSETFGILPDDRRRHIYIIGKTGMGKSTLLENMIFSDIYSGKGVAVVDPHGELADAIVKYVPRERAEDLIICDPSDISNPVSINMLEDPGTAEARSLIASGLVGVFKKMFADSWGPRLEHVLRNVLLALAEYPNSNMLGIMRILVDEEYRKKVVDNVTDPVVKQFWVGEFANYAPRNVAEIISPIQNKVGQFLSSPIIRNIVGQTKSTIRIREAMDDGKILIVNLSKGKIGEDNSALLGSMIITRIQLDAMSRANIEASKRRDFYLYVDEFQNFATDSFATILSEARKYKLNLIIANQYIAQMSEIVRDAVFGNVGTIITFQTGYDDALYLSTQFSEVVTPEDITALNKYTIYTRLLINGMPSKSFSANTLPSPDVNVNPELTEYLKNLSRHKYSRTRKSVEDDIKKWSEETKSDENHSSSNSESKSKKKIISNFDINTLTIGQSLKTNVVGKCDYGIFLCFQGIEGLLHINKIPEDRRSMMKTVNKGDLIEALVFDINKESNKLAFSLLSAEETISKSKEKKSSEQILIPG